MLRSGFWRGVDWVGESGGSLVGGLLVGGCWGLWRMDIGGGWRLSLCPPY